MSSWRKIGLAISILWIIGLLIFLGVVHSTWQTVADVLFAANLNSLTLWTVMLGPVVLLWSIGIITAEVIQWIKRRQTTVEEAIEEQDGEGSIQGGRDQAERAIPQQENGPSH